MTESSILLIIGGLWTLIVTILWLVIGWRAMKAHELLAQSHLELFLKLDKLAAAIKDKNA